MKKNTITFVVVILLGLLTGTILSELLAPVPALSFLTKYAEIEWQPRANFNFLAYDLHFLVRINLIGLVCLAAAFWIYRKL
ncbi:DUF4321 domain-containing protein [Paenibacillus turpanensis]|uniref:DUF4321 domain-containing protein n=1 Tax=Paenibacillus turpanensis TaxID=2689078 RepID=UPI001FB5E8CC|nr:DUF4321 domain-containing protein [Paenibacillus turpanensis]